MSVRLQVGAAEAVAARGERGERAWRAQWRRERQRCAQALEHGASCLGVGEGHAELLVEPAWVG